MLDIFYTELAHNDLFHIFELISQDKPSSAVHYITKIEKNIELLQSNPELGLECKSKNINKDCGILVFENYLIFYKIKEDQIHIIRILNAKIDYKEELN